MRGGFFGLLVAILLIAAVLGVGVYGYNIGVTQGLADSGKLTTPATGVPPYPYYGPFFHHPFGWGFGGFGCLFPLLFFFLFFGIARGFLWRGHWGWGHHVHHGDWDKGVPPRFEEWHKRSHEPQSTENR